ncbi:hypothetical protein FGO68_gene7508 [Halteria grandinella]|uniref:Uncharacterized protein n=1 Tax=Halteria grandinella TaxID=5974 RepID=A0A8J8NLF4_HALGN|nr:hypothetical protein FGO68_gene7508 [Halteria grandinella]
MVYLQLKVPKQTGSRTFRFQQTSPLNVSQWSPRNSHSAVSNESRHFRAYTVSLRELAWIGLLLDKHWKPFHYDVQHNDYPCWEVQV